MTLYTGHGGSGTSLSFTAGNIAGTRVEMKVCESCSGMFIRETYPAQAPRRDCNRCIAAGEQRRAKEVRELSCTLHGGSASRAR